MNNASAISIRHELRPGDLGEIVRQHGVLYAREYGFDQTFEAYVAGPLAEFVKAGTGRDRLWIAEAKDQFAGSVAILSGSSDAAQLRWFLVHPAMRGQGLGRRLLNTAVAFAGAQGCHSIFLWTVSQLTTAARLYQSAGFRRVQERPGRLWGTEVIEERFVLQLTAPESTPVKSDQIG
jgi:GNAT superfamily N-acetyltransferase